MVTKSEHTARRRVTLTAAFCILALAVLNPTALASEDEAAARASSSMSTYSLSQDGWNFSFWAWRNRSIASGAGAGSTDAAVISQGACVRTFRYNIDTTVEPKTMVRLSEQGCSDALDSYTLDPKSWQAMVSGSVATSVEKLSYGWDEQKSKWALVGRETWEASASFDLEWLGAVPVFGRYSYDVAYPIVDGPQVVCLFYGPPFIWPCPALRPIKAGLTRGALVKGPTSFGGLGITFGTTGSYSDDRAWLDIWWQS